MDKIAQLAAAGFTISPQNDRQAAVLQSLSDEEVRVLLSVKQRVGAASSDVEGHLSEIGSVGGWLW
jgi:hypothetical protein